MESKRRTYIITFLYYKSLGRYEEAMVATFDGVQPEATKQDKQKWVHQLYTYLGSHEEKKRFPYLPRLLS
jgi:hypothetical protein